MTETQLEKEVLMHLENAACCGRNPGDFRDYCERLTRSLMNSINKYKEIEKVIKTVEGEL